MLKSIKILLKADCQGWLNSLKHSREAWRKGILKGIGYLILVVALSVLGSSLFRHLRLTEADSTLVLGVINGFMTFGVIIVAKELMESSLKILYEAPETALLHAAPIRPVATFGYKFIYLIITRLLSILCFLGTPMDCVWCDIRTPVAFLHRTLSSMRMSSGNHRKLRYH